MSLISYLDDKPVSVVIDAYLFAAGGTWNKILYDFCESNDINHDYSQLYSWFGNLIPEELSQLKHLDLIIIYHLSDATEYEAIVVEFKYKDLHATLTKQGTGGCFRDEMNLYYLPLRTSGIVKEVLVFVANDIPVPFSTVKTKLLAHIKAIIADKRTKSTPDSIRAEMEEYADFADKTIAFIHDQAINFRDEANITSFCSSEGIPCFIEESQKKCLDKLYEYVMGMATPHEYNRPDGVNMSKIASYFERMILTYPGMTDKRMAELKDRCMKYCNDLERPWSLNGIAQLDAREYDYHGGLSDGFWIKFWEMWSSGENAKLMKDRKKGK